MITESPEQTQSAILQILLRVLQYKEFCKLEPEAQAVHLDEAQRMLKSKTVEMATKRQLLNFLDALRGIGDHVEARVQAIRDDWDAPPF